MGKEGNDLIMILADKDAIMAKLRRKEELKKKRSPGQYFIETDAKYEFLLNQASRYYSVKLDKLSKEYISKIKKIDNALSDELSVLSKREMDIINRLAHDPSALRSATVPICKQRREAIASGYTKWRDEMAVHYTRICKLMDDYYQYTGPYIRHIKDNETRQFAEAGRKLTVYSALMPVSGDFMARPLLYAMGKVTIGAGTSCTPPPPPPDQYQIVATEVPKEQKKECPFNPPFKAGLVIASIKLSCEAVEVEAGQGLIGALKYDFVKREHTVFLGVGHQFKSFGSAVSGQVGVKAGIYITADVETGNVTDIGIKGSASLDVGMGAGKGLPKLGTEGEAEVQFGWKDISSASLVVGNKPLKSYKK